MTDDRRFFVAIELEGPDPDALAGVLEVLTDLNTRWYLEQWADGRQPPVSAKAAGIVWMPDCPADEVIYEIAPLVFARGEGSCGPIAAIAAAYLRATAIRRGADWDVARRQYRVQLRPLRKDAEQIILHAVVQTPAGPRDVTVGMERRNPQCPTS